MSSPLELAELGSQSGTVVEHGDQSTIKGSRKRPCKVLDEDNYLDKIEKIVERDFFPDLPKLKAQLAYQKALEENDVVEMNRLKEQFSGRISTLRPDTVRSNVGSFSTPIPPQSDGLQAAVGSDTNPSKDSSSAPNMSLDKFLRKYTSEDNHSFEEIQEEAHSRERARVPWLYEDESTLKIKYDKSLELPSIQEQALKGRDTQNIITWKYKNKNSVMFNPDGLPIEEQQVPKSLQVVHKNTRLVGNQSKSADVSTVDPRLVLNAGKIGPDGKVIEPSNQLKNYDMVRMTPTPSMINTTPLMTWGEIDGTPFRLDAPETPVECVPLGTPHFKIPDIPERDKIGMSLADNVSRMYRDRKQKALKHVTSKLKSPFEKVFSSHKTTTDQLNQLSPAARRLATVQLGLNKVRDPKLQAAYSPSPQSLATPSPRSTRSTPTVASSPATPSLSLTDNLLKISKK